jgi:hypothetical protein
LDEWLSSVHQVPRFTFKEWSERQGKRPRVSINNPFLWRPGKWDNDISFSKYTSWDFEAGAGGFMVESLR